MLLAEMVFFHVQYSSLEQPLLWAMIGATSMAVVLSSLRWRRPMLWIILGGVCLVLAMVFGSVLASSFTPLPPGPPGRIISVSDPWPLLLLAVSTFSMVVGVVAVLCGLFCLRSVRRRAARG